MNLTRTEAEARARLIANPKYRVELDLTGDGPRFFSRTTIDFEAATPGADSFIDLLDAEVSGVELNGRQLEPSPTDGRLHLADLQPTNHLVVEARPAYSHTGEGLHRFTDPVDQATYLYTQFEPADAQRVFAVFDQPDIKGVFTFEVKAPPAWKVLSNQNVAEVEGQPDGIVHRFEPTPRLSSYLTAIAAGPWAEWRGQVESADGRRIPLRLFARQSLAEHVDADNLFQITRQGFSFYEPAFGHPFPFAKYDQVFCPEYNFGAMENAGLVTITERYVFRSKPTGAAVERRAVTVLHELAHMWFGDLVTMRWWDDLWLNESFAEFVSHLAAAEATEWTDAWATFSWSEKLWAYRQDQLPTTHPILAPINSIADVHNNFDGITYAKGASVLRQLVAWVGQDAFLAALRAYFQRHAWGNTTLRDLLAELEAASGRDLAAWGRAWLETAGVNTVTARPMDDAGRLALAQTGAAGQLSWRPQLVGLGGYRFGSAMAGEADAGGSGPAPKGGPLTRAWAKQVDLTGPKTAFGQLDAAELVLVNDQDLAYAKVRLDPASLAAAQAHVGQLADPVARAVVWGALWDMTRDAELPARRFADLILTWVAGETNSTGMRKLLDLLATALEFYTAPEHRLVAQTDAAERLWALAVQAEPGSDAQLQLTKASARHGVSQGQLDRIDELLSGSRSLTGLALDTDLRWDLLSGLVAAGRAGEDRIDAQLDLDRTAAGLEQAAGLRAAQPTPEAKAAAWLRAVEDPATPNETQRS
ncbi:MAG: aminopeptidase N, partial [Bifidobacteriaceae bacterium]|nr:aminopeptidase N [Bifidobacteriaceae bacterium]